MTFSDMTRFFIQNAKMGHEVDFLIQAFAAVNLENPFLHIELDSIDELLFMRNGCDAQFIYMSPDNKESMFIALYKATERSPLARCYFIRQKNKEALQKQFLDQNIRFDVINDLTFFHLIEHATLAQRKERHLKRQDEKTGGIKKLFEGRKQNTTTSGGIVLQSDNCLICDAPITHNLSTTLSADKGLLISFNVCHSCHEKAKEYDGTNFAFLLDALKTPNFFTSSSNVSNNELIEISKEIIQDKLQCRIEKISGMEITARRESNFKIIFRLLGTNDNKISYGYMIFDTNDVQVARFDSAGHHNDILEIGPDHLHYDLKTSNKLVQSSYLTGYLSLDYIGIEQLLRELESM